MLPGEKENGMLEDLGAVMGTEASVRLVAVFGGATLYVPQVAEGGHPIEHVVGRRPYQRLVDAFGGETIWIPGGSDFLRLRRMRQVVRLLSEGMSVEELSQRFNYSIRQIRNIGHQAARMGLDGRRLPQD
ncbi:helix-turn-helix domain-containing protein [Thauera sp. CAU 1555]|uniref:Helix-turn-helix domain-containing protein n=1 Tax=Thauera sedimentorum TaxID=2767595 RepID=A0ABR9B8R5_9RHOO|nr:helix-turn-helix domain-containing protein [Thauera sedimentorum]MBC9071835.1 helix-turn-helix domain-containing protein [Thauera sedimentorum]MBD8502754.1 helix-turn-helix domain-containing protein [Thauera sedimentorum]